MPINDSWIYELVLPAVCRKLRIKDWEFSSIEDLEKNLLRHDQQIFDEISLYTKQFDLIEDKMHKGDVVTLNDVNARDGWRTAIHASIDRLIKT